MKMRWRKWRLKRKYLSFLRVRNRYDCGDALFFAARPDMQTVWDFLCLERKAIMKDESCLNQLS